MIKLLNLSIKQLEAMNRLRGGCTQKIVIQHQSNIQMNGDQNVVANAAVASEV